MYIKKALTQYVLSGARVLIYILSKLKRIRENLGSSMVVCKGGGEGVNELTS